MDLAWERPGNRLLSRTLARRDNRARTNIEPESIYSDSSEKQIDRAVVIHMARVVTQRHTLATFVTSRSEAIR